MHSPAERAMLEFFARFPQQGPGAPQDTIAALDVVGAHTMSDEGWNRYYGLVAGALHDGRGPAAKSEFAASLREELNIWRRSERSFGYVFYVLRPY